MADEPGTPPTEQMVPISRMNAKTAENTELNKQLIAMKAEQERLAGLVLGYESRYKEAEAKSAEVPALQQQIEDLKAAHAEASAMVAAGLIDEDAQALARIKYGKLEDGTEFKAYLDGLVAEPPAWTGISRSDEVVTPEATAAGDGLPPAPPVAVPGTRNTLPTPPAAPDKAPGDYTPEEWATVRDDVVSKVPGYK